MGHIPEPRRGSDEDDDGWADEDAPPGMKMKPKNDDEENKDRKDDKGTSTG